MLKTIVKDVDIDHYVYDTELSFGKAFGEKILTILNNTPEVFPIRYNYSSPKNPKELIRKVGRDTAEELYRRLNRARDLCGGIERLNFSQRFLTEELSEEFLSLLPEWLKYISPGEPSPILQISQNGDFLTTHKGHKRRCSLFMLLQENHQETRWYRNTETFEVVDCLRIPDPDKIEHVVTAVMEPWRWYVFNHFEWHSVHNFQPGNIRVNIGLDFNNIDADELVARIKEYNGK